MTKMPALRITQRPVNAKEAPVTLYVGTLMLSDLAKHAAVDTYSVETPDGYQRPLEARRLRDIATYVRAEAGILPTSILVGTRPTDRPEVTPVDFKSVYPGAAFGFLEIPDGARLWLIDGQHRYHGVLEAYEDSGRDERLADYPFPVCVLSDVDQYAEMNHFHTINTKQKKMSTDIVDRHLVQRLEREGNRFSGSEKELLQAAATKLVDKLDETPGPWKGNIQIPGVVGRDRGLVRQHAFVTALQPVLKDPWVRGRSEKEQLQVVVNFWEAARSVWPEAFDDPGSYRIQATVGLYSLHMLLPVLIQRCLASREMTTEKMAELLRGMPDVDSTFWHKTDGDALTVGSAMSSIRRLAAYLIDQLPQAEVGSVKL